MRTYRVIFYQTGPAVLQCFEDDTIRFAHTYTNMYKLAHVAIRFVSDEDESHWFGHIEEAALLNPSQDELKAKLFRVVNQGDHPNPSSDWLNERSFAEAIFEEVAGLNLFE